MCSNQVKRDQGRVPFTHLLRRAVIGAQGDSKTNNERKHDTTESVGVARDILRSMERKTAVHLRHSINISMVYQVKLLLIRLHLQSNNRLFSPTRNKSITCSFFAEIPRLWRNRWSKFRENLIVIVISSPPFSLLDLLLFGYWLSGRYGNLVSAANQMRSCENGSEEKKRSPYFDLFFPFFSGLFLFSFFFCRATSGGITRWRDKLQTHKSTSAVS